MGAAEIMGSLFGVRKVFGHFRVTLSVLEERTSLFFPGTNRFFHEPLFQRSGRKVWVKIPGESSGRISRLLISEDEIGGDSSDGNMGSTCFETIPRTAPGPRVPLARLRRDWACSFGH